MKIHPETTSQAAQTATWPAARAAPQTRCFAFSSTLPSTRKTKPPPLPRSPFWGAYKALHAGSLTLSPAAPGSQQQRRGFSFTSGTAQAAASGKATPHQEQGEETENSLIPHRHAGEPHERAKHALNIKSSNETLCAFASVALGRGDEDLWHGMHTQKRARASVRNGAARPSLPSARLSKDSSSRHAPSRALAASQNTWPVTFWHSTIFLLPAPLRPLCKRRLRRDAEQQHIRSAGQGEGFACPSMGRGDATRPQITRAVTGCHRPSMATWSSSQVSRHPDNSPTWRSGIYHPCSSRGKGFKAGRFPDSSERDAGKVTHRQIHFKGGWLQLKDTGTPPEMLAPGGRVCSPGSCGEPGNPPSTGQRAAQRHPQQGPSRPAAQHQERESLRSCARRHIVPLHPG